ncbi:hypothetical protein V2O64_14090 [Verrucomicrobiaceae bacterium 227]
MIDYFVANSGSALVSDDMKDLTKINYLIVILEGLLISKILNISRLRCVLIMTVANLVSASIGYSLSKNGIYSLDVTIESVKWVLTIAIITSLILTLILEYPFVAWIASGLNFTSTQKIRALLIVHFVSYSTIVLPWYFFINHFSLLKLDTTTVEDLCEDPHRLAFISRDRKKIILYDLTSHKIVGSYPFKGTYSPFTPWYFRSDLEFEHSQFLPSSEDNRWSRVAVRQLRDPETLEVELEADSDSDWKNGLRIRDSRSGSEDFYKLKTPFIDWNISSATQLKDGLVVFELGGNQICLADFRKKQIALIGRGFDPVVLEQTARPKKDLQ